MEWDYGDYEGRKTVDIREERPGWTLWQDGVPGGETAEDVGARADRVIPGLRSLDGDAVVFAHGHLLRVLAARWLGLEPAAGQLFALDPATVGVLGYERETAVLRRLERRRPLVPIQQYMPAPTTEGRARAGQGRAGG